MEVNKDKQDENYISPFDWFKCVEYASKKEYKVQEVIATKTLRKDLREQLRLLEIIPQRRETALAKTKLQEAIMWLGQNLRALDEENPYPESDNPENTIIAPEAEQKLSSKKARQKCRVFFLYRLIMAFYEKKETSLVYAVSFNELLKKVIEEIDKTLKEVGGKCKLPKRIKQMEFVYTVHDVCSDFRRTLDMKYDVEQEHFVINDKFGLSENQVLIIEETKNIRTEHIDKFNREYRLARSV